MVVRLNPRFKQKFIEGKICPPNGNYAIQFRLDSVIAGSNNIAAFILINSDIPEENRLPVTFVSDIT